MRVCVRRVGLGVGVERLAVARAPLEDVHAADAGAEHQEPRRGVHAQQLDARAGHRAHRVRVREALRVEQRGGARGSGARAEATARSRRPRRAARA